MKFKVSDTFNCSADFFWENLFFDETYSRRQYLEALGFASFEMPQNEKKEDGTRFRTVRIEPKADAPEVVKKLVGGNLFYVESGRFDPKEKKWIYSVETSKMADKVKVNGVLWLEDRGPNRSERFSEVEVTVSIFGVGKIVESFIQKSTIESHTKAADFTNKYLLELQK